MKWLFDTMTRKYSFSRGNHEPKKIKENIWGVFFFSNYCIKCYLFEQGEWDH